jgi:hypothetical protein
MQASDQTAAVLPRPSKLDAYRNGPDVQATRDQRMSSDIAIHSTDKWARSAKDNKRQLVMERTNRNFDKESYLCESMMNQLSNRMTLMQSAVQELQSSVRIQLAVREYASRRALHRLKSKRLLCDWIFCHFHMRRRAQARNRLCQSFWLYHMRLKKVKFFHKILAAIRICATIYKYAERRKALRRRYLLKTAHQVTSSIVKAAASRAKVKIENDKREWRAARRRLSRLIWPQYVKYKRKQM